MKIEVIPSIPAHVPELVRNLREADRREMTCLGFLPRRVVWRSYKGSIMRRTCMIDDQVGAMWGVSGTIADRVARPWLLTTPLVEAAYSEIGLKIAREELNKMLEAFGHLQNYVDASYTKAIRLLKILGFEIQQPEPMAPTGALFRRFDLKRD